MSISIYKHWFMRIILISTFCVASQAQASFVNGFLNGFLVSLSGGAVGLRGPGFFFSEHRYTLGAVGSWAGSAYAFVSGVNDWRTQGQSSYAVGKMLGSSMSAVAVACLWRNGMVPNAAYFRK